MQIQMLGCKQKKQDKTVQDNFCGGGGGGGLEYMENIISIQI